ncbi:MAG: XRE family transcriptional regulator [Proteobacteria bacterium]|nr:XRE family transcriptional regulator [Pseudomonadota bacterium]
MGEQIKVDVGSDNIFADLGLADPEAHRVKAELASRIGEALRARMLTQAAAAELLGIDQPKVSRLLRGYLTHFSAERLMRFLTLLGRDVEIVVRPAPQSRRRGRVRVVEAA